MISVPLWVFLLVTIPEYLVTGIAFTVVFIRISRTHVPDDSWDTLFTLGCFVLLWPFLLAMGLIFGLGWTSWFLNRHIPENLKWTSSSSPSSSSGLSSSSPG